MRRRTFTAGALALAVAPGRAWAQAPGRTYRIAVWHGARPLAEMADNGAPPYRAFFQALAREGYVEGRNLVVDRYTAEGRPERYTAIAQQIVASRPDVIVPTGETLAMPTLALTTSIPIVVPAFSDPVAYGLVPSLSRPGGNLTGFTNDAGIELGGLRLQLLKEAAPRTKRLACLATTATVFERMRLVLEEAATSLGVALVMHVMAGPFDAAAYRTAFAELTRQGVEGVYLTVASEHLVNRKLIVELAAAASIPAIYSWRDFVDDGGLMAYGANLIDNYRKAAGYVARILGGEKPGELPIQQPTVFDMIVNVKTAKALGLTLPETIFFRATEVIE